VEDPVAAADRLCHRVAEPEAGGGKRGASMHGAVEERRACLEIVAVLEHGGERLADQARSLEGVLVALGVPALHVERLRAVSERVHRRAAAQLARQIEQ
jgi:hypothetical protein